MKWTKQDEEKLREITHTNAELATILGRTESAIRLKRKSLCVQLQQESSFESDKQKISEGHWRERYAELEKKYQTALKEQVLTDRLVAMAASLAPQSYDPLPGQPIKAVKSGEAQSAVLMLSDTHIGQVIDGDQTLGFGGYNFKIFMARLKFLERSVSSIIQNHMTVGTQELVLCLGGDMIDGALNHSAEIGQQNTLFTQFYAGGHVLAQFIRNVASLVPKVRVYCTAGNHPRWGTQKKMPTKNRYSNLDTFLYAYIQALTRDLGSVEWTLNMQPVQRFAVQSFIFQLMHGDTLRGGDKSLGVPNHAVGRMLSSVSQQCGKRKTTSPHYFLVGHLHRSIVLPHAKGSVIVNGGFPGIDGYALANEFTAVDPSQVFFFVHPKYGKTATYDLGLQHAEVTTPAPYLVPDEFPIL